MKNPDQIGNRSDRARRADRERAPLAAIHHVDRALQHDVLRLRRPHGSAAPALPSRSPRNCASIPAGRAFVGADHAALREVVLHVDQQTPSAEVTPGFADDHDRDRELARDVDAVQRTGAAERHQREIARSRSRADRDQPAPTSDMLAFATLRMASARLMQAGGRTALPPRPRRRGAPARDRASPCPAGETWLPSRPIVTLASVFVGCVLPLP